MMSRWLWRRRVARVRAQGRYQTAVLVVGEREAAIALADELTRDPRDGYRVVGLSIAARDSLRAVDVTVNGRSVPVVDGDVVPAAVRCGADTVAVAGMGGPGAQDVRRLSWELEPTGFALVVSPGVRDVALSRLMIRSVGGSPLLHVEQPRYHDAQRLEKQLFDVCFAAAAMVVTLPVIAVAAAAIKMNTRGPVLYCAERIGRDGAPFRMFKLRTMVAGADAQVAELLSGNDSDGPLFKMHDDPRVTSVGRVLRRFSIDELPQFINVLRREMSVVGPRPPLRREVQAYDGDVRRRLLVKPGITGMWQVSGRSDLSWASAVRLDLAYVDNWSMVGDLVIIAKTVRAVFQRHGAY